MISNESSGWPAHWASSALFVALLVITTWGALTLADDFGVSWDESVQAEYAERVWVYFATGGADSSCNEFLDLMYYGPTADLLAAAIYRGQADLPADGKFVIRHVVTAGFGIVTMIPLFALARWCVRPHAAWLSAAALLCLPRFVGHAFVNSKDIPFACLFAITVWAATAYFAATDRRKWMLAVLTGGSWGLLASIRPGGWILMSVIVSALLLFAHYVQRRRSPQEPFGLHLVTMLAVSWGIMVAVWPWAHGHPLLHPITAMRVASHFHLEIPVLFEGHTHVSTELPWYYLPKFLVITVPIFVWGLVAAGFLAAAVEQIRDLRSSRSLAFFAMQAWLLLPVALYFVSQPNLYDGMRHFLFLLPAIALWAGIGAAELWRHLETSKVRWLYAIVLCGCVAHTARDTVRLHPYQMTYFSPIVGGLAGAQGSYETEYWVTSYRAAMEWIREQAPEDTPLRVLVAANEHSRACAEVYRGPNVRVDIVSSFGNKGPLPEPYDFYIGTYRSQMSDNFPDSPIVHVVQREGAVFSVVRQRTSPQGPRTRLVAQHR